MAVDSLSRFSRNGWEEGPLRVRVEARAKCAYGGAAVFSTSVDKHEAA